MGNWHLVRRTGVKTSTKILVYVVGVIVSLIIGGILLTCLGINPFDYYSKMLSIGLIGNRYPEKSIEGLIKIFVPLLITSVALALSFKMKFWNIGGEGEFIVGALTAAFFAYKLQGLPSFIVVLVMCLAGGFVSGMIGLSIAYLKTKHNTNETLVTLMLNYIMLYLIKYIGETKADWNFFLREDSERPVFGKFPESATMPSITIGNLNITLSLVFGILIAVAIYFYLKKTKQGYEISVVGDSQDTARYAGMKVGRIVLRTMFISAFLIGLSGAFSAAVASTISTSITNNVGWTGVIVAWLSKLSIPAISVASLLISILQYGSQAAATSYPAIDRNFADLLQGIILFLVLASDFLVTFKIVKKTEE